MPFNDIITYEAVGVDGVTYRVTAGSDPVTRGQGGAPTGSERSFDERNERLPVFVFGLVEDGIVIAFGATDSFHK